MAVVEFEEGTLSIDAAVIGRGLSVEPWLVQARMREGKITVLWEHGVDEDAAVSAAPAAASREVPWPYGSFGRREHQLRRPVPRERDPAE